jgi:hypothetical protein
LQSEKCDILSINFTEKRREEKRCSGPRMQSTSATVGIVGDIFYNCFNFFLLYLKFVSVYFNNLFKMCTFHDSYQTVLFIKKQIKLIGDNLPNCFLPNHVRK